MKNMVAMLDQAKHVEREKVCNPKKEVIQKIQEQIQDQSQTQTAEVSAERIQITEPQLSKNLINQILNDDDLLILVDDVQDDVMLIATIGVLLVEFIMKEN